MQLPGIARMFSSELTLASAWIHLLVVDLFAARSWILSFSWFLILCIFIWSSFWLWIQACFSRWIEESDWNSAFCFFLLVLLPHWDSYSCHYQSHHQTCHKRGSWCIEAPAYTQATRISFYLNKSLTKKCLSWTHEFSRYLISVTSRSKQKDLAMRCNWNLWKK